MPPSKFLNSTRPYSMAGLSGAMTLKGEIWPGRIGLYSMSA
jgi:hypothetical protein